MSIELPVRLPLSVRVPKISSVVCTEIGSGAAPTTIIRPRGASPAISGDIDAPLAAVAMIAAAPPSFCNAAPGSSPALSM